MVIKMNLLKFDLGGIGHNPGYKTVNLSAAADLCYDIMHLDKFCQDDSVDEFYLSHTLEHIPIIYYSKFILDMKRKLKINGKIKIVQTDIGQVIKMIVNNEISFRSGRSTIFTPASRCSSNILQQHQNMWSAEELAKDFKEFGFKTEIFDAGYWIFDIDDDILKEENCKDYGKHIPNLGVIATKT